VGVTSRIFQLHQLLKKERRLSLQGMMDRLEVSKATIKRDLDLLRDQLGAPLIYDRHDNAYYYATGQGEFELPGLWFNKSELYALLASEQLLESVQPGFLGPHIGPLKTRIRALLEKSGHTSDTVTTRIILQPMGSRGLESHCFGTVAGAVLDGNVLDIDYHGRGKGEWTRRRIHPLRLLHYRDNWYVIAWCESADALRTFSLDRVANVHSQDIPQRQIDEEALRRHLNAGFGIFADEPRDWAVLRFTPHMSRWVADEQWHPRQVGKWLGECYELHVPYANPTELLMDILKYGPDVEVVAPAALSAMVEERLRQALRQYQKR
jgi:predicted DNA-binding transcriptional regulator YafY